MNTYGFDLSENDILLALEDFHKNKGGIDELTKSYPLGKPQTRYIQFKGELFGLKRTFHHAYFLKYGTVNNENPVSDSYEAILRKIPSARWRIVRLESGEVLKKLNEPTNPEDEVVMRAIRERRGQASFREKLLNIYDRRCCVSGSTVEYVLEASHIKNHSEGGNYETRNGLLLRADIHTLFDLGLIGVDENYRVTIHRDLEETEYAKYKGQKISLPKDESEYPKFSYKSSD